jgi:hypothetical protein
MRSLATVLAAITLLFSATAFAQELGQDEVTLKNGGVVRGTVIAAEPGLSVKILEFGQKEPRVIPWSQVSDVERGKYAPRRPAQPGPAGPGYGAPPAPPAPAEPQMGAPGVVRLHIESPTPAQLIEHGGTAIGSYGGYGVVIHQMRPVCMSPCDRVIDGTVGQQFSLTGEFPPPPPFRLLNLRGDVDLEVKPGSRGGMVGGGTMVTLGGISLLTGLILLPVSLSGHLECDYTLGGPCTKVRSSGFVGTSVAMTIGGAALLAGGIVLAIRSRTLLDIRPHGAPPAQAARAPRYWLGEF